MWRNREIRQQITAMIVVAAVLTGTAFLLKPVFGLLCLAASIVMICVEWGFLRKRYGEIERLAEALRMICAGETDLDVRDNEEGELSILKSEIYKVTRTLSEQGKLYKTDQERLAAAIADISHQLKTPLTSMTLMADLLRQETLEPEQRETFTKRIQTQVSRMDWLLSSLLKLSKIDAGTAVFEVEKVLVTDLIEQAMEPVIIPMDIKNQTVSVEGEPGVSFKGDLSWTAEAVLNVMKNCVEHTPENGHLDVAFSENPLYTEIEISDNGKGIAKEDLPYIFKRFYRGRNASKDSAGIGLAMAESIVKRQNGELTVSSEEGKGSTFRFRFYKRVV